MNGSSFYQTIIPELNDKYMKIKNNNSESTLFSSTMYFKLLPPASATYEFKIETEGLFEMI